MSELLVKLEQEHIAAFDKLIAAKYYPTSQLHTTLLEAALSKEEK